MNEELELLTFSTFAFTVLMVACFKPFRHNFFGDYSLHNRMTQEQKYEEQKAFSKELEEITSDFQDKYMLALKGELKR